jgi:hypothetical protein
MQTSACWGAIGRSTRSWRPSWREDWPAPVAAASLPARGRPPQAAACRAGLDVSRETSNEHRGPTVSDRRIDRPLSTDQRSTSIGQWGCRAQQSSRRNQTRLGRRLRLELVGELADLRCRVAAVAAKGLQER